MHKFEVGDLVREVTGGQVMRVIGFLESPTITLCEMASGFRKIARVAVLALAPAAMAPEAAHGNQLEDRPSQPGVEQQRQAAAALPSLATSTSASFMR
jgi:hypothetical protein